MFVSKLRLCKAGRLVVSDKCDITHLGRVYPKGSVIPYKPSIQVRWLKSCITRGLILITEEKPVVEVKEVEEVKEVKEVKAKPKPKAIKPKPKSTKIK